MLCYVSQEAAGQADGSLHMCIKETTRIFAPVPMISRCLDKTYEIGGHHVPEGKYTEQL